MDVSAATPRVNAAMLPGLVGRKVLLVGRVRERRGGDTARAFFFRASRAAPRSVRRGPPGSLHSPTSWAWREVASARVECEKRAQARLPSNPPPPSLSQVTNVVNDAATLATSDGGVVTVKMDAGRGFALDSPVVEFEGVVRGADAVEETGRAMFSQNFGEKRKGGGARLAGGRGGKEGSRRGKGARWHAARAVRDSFTRSPFSSFLQTWTPTTSSSPRPRPRTSTCLCEWRTEEGRGRDRGEGGRRRFRRPPQCCKGGGPSLPPPAPPPLLSLYIPNTGV
jgi:hypothetical protein